MESIPLDGPFGARVDGVDLHGLDPSVGLPRREGDALLEALVEHGVLLLRRQLLDETQFAALARSLGRVESHPNPRALSRDVEGVVWVSNLHDGRGRALGGLGEADVSWHQDSYYKPRPYTVSMIQAVLPTARGGVTEWANTRRAWATLPEALRKKVAGRRGLHPLPDSMTRRRGWRRRRPAPMPQPLEMSHPRRPEACLYVSERTVGIEGMDDAEAGPLLDALRAHVVRPENVLSHVWRPGDLVLYDNVQTIHRRSAFEGPRLLWVTRFELP